MLSFINLRYILNYIYIDRFEYLGLNLIDKGAWTLNHEKPKIKTNIVVTCIYGQHIFQIKSYSMIMKSIT